MTKKLSTDEFIVRAKAKHGDRYDYNNTVYKQSTVKVRILCKLHGEFVQAPYAHLQGNGCKLCMGATISNKLSLPKDEFLRRAKELHGDMYDYTDIQYKNNHVPISIYCKTHKVYFNQVPEGHLVGTGCKQCRYEKSAKSMSMGKDEFLRRAKELHGGAYDYSLVEYKNNSTKVRIICGIHGEFLQTPASHLSGCGCYLCAGRTKLTIADFVNKAIAVHGDAYDYSFVHYVNSDTKVKIRCRKHDLIFEQIPFHHTAKKYGCPKCGDKKCADSLRMSLETFVFRAVAEHGDKYDYSNVVYSNNGTPVDIFCKSCNKLFSQRPSSHLQGCGCPTCFNSESKGEREIKEWIQSLGIKTEKTDKIIHPLEIDIYLPEYKVGIEYNGLHWHSESRGKDSKYHLRKTELALKAGVHLMQFWDIEWNNKQDIVKSIILNRLGKYQFRLFARKLQVKDINSRMVRMFCIENHIHGFRGGSKYVGLFDGNILVSLVIVGADGELVRYVVKKFTTVIGGFAKLLAHVDVKYSFVDRRIFTGNSYYANGFTLHSITPPNYYYTAAYRSLESRNKFQKHKLAELLEEFNPDLSEVQNMYNNGYDRIFDCGNLKFIRTSS